LKQILPLLFLCNFAASFAQQTFRRHFLIAYDVSTPFMCEQKNCAAFQNAVVNLFANQTISGFNEANQDNLLTERKNNVVFFDEKRDEISFFHFNVARSEFADLQWAANNLSNEQEIVSAFTSRFVKDKVFNWSEYKESPTQYIRTAFAFQPAPADFGGGVSMSNFVYPLVLDRMKNSSCAEEYVLILLSDFLTGAMLGNTKDLNRVRDIYQVPYNAALSPTSPVTYIKKRIDYLSAQYYKLDYFQYAFLVASNNHWDSNKQIAIIGLKIKPKIGVSNPEDVALFVDGNLDLDQKGYQSQNFKMSDTKIKFTHNKNLVPTELRMTILLPADEGNTVIFDDVIAKPDEAGRWFSDYTSDKDLMQFDNDAYTYFVPKLNIELNPAVYEKNFENLTVQYQFKAKYEIPDAQPLGFVYKTERALPVTNIYFTTKTSNIIMYYVLPAVLILLLIIGIIAFLVSRGKPRNLSLKIQGYLDSYEKIDYKTDGKFLTPYKKWDYEKYGDVDILPVSGFVKSKWTSPVAVKLQVEKLPDGFELFLRRNSGGNEYSAALDMPLIIKTNGRFSFEIGIRQTDINKEFNEPELIKFTVTAKIDDSCFGIKAEIETKEAYKFHIGPDLQDVWVAFDPGTTGSCVAVGSESGNIRLLNEEDKNTKGIVPSVITFDTKQNCNEPNIPVYEYGVIANNLRYGNAGYAGFKSMKKMLGFKTAQEIKFNNGNKLLLKGKDLASLLVKGLYSDVNADFNKLTNADEYKREGKFNPQRAVVCIPNNFTAGKIQDMVDCITNLQQFKEIRYVYEAEAVLFHYLATRNVQNNETILVFDMGGATINATVVTVKKIKDGNNDKYDIDILGKIGYGIGGDTIDYCIIKFLTDFKKEFYELSNLGIIKDKIKLAKLAFEIKKEIIANYDRKNDYLITASTLERHISDILEISVKLEKETKKTETNAEGETVTKTVKEPTQLYKLFLKERDDYKLFSHKYFTEIIYNNVKEAVKEALDLANVPVDKVIFAGRSSAFPLIKETVKSQLDKKVQSIDFGFDELKTAVAKGACWYGTHINAVQLHNLKTTASFGFRQTLYANRSNVRFHSLIAMGQDFDADNDGISYFKNSEYITDTFNFDSNKVNFYQIMGKDADAILSEDQKHKYSKIATIRIDQATAEVAMQVSENDEIDCRVRLQNNRVLSEKGAVADQEIDEANAEHYTWIVK
jgi:molecular chaperone DnaK (HSP70)